MFKKSFFFVVLSLALTINILSLTFFGNGVAQTSVTLSAEPTAIQNSQGNSTLSHTSGVVSIEERLVNNSLLIQERLGNIVNELEGIKNASLQSGRAMVDTESNNEQFAIVSLGGAFGGAIAGGFVSSYLQARFSNASRRNSDHLQELKERIVISLLDSTLDRNFWSLETLFTGFRITTNAIPKSDDVLFQDFMENHYSNIKTELGSYETRADI